MADRKRKKYLWRTVSGQHCPLAEGAIGALAFRCPPRRYYWRTNGFTHRVGRVLSFSPVVGIGALPTPHPLGRMPPPLWFRGEGHTRWRERGWESPNSDEGTYMYTLVLCKYMYFVVSHLLWAARTKQNKKKRRTEQFGAPRLFSS